MHKAIQQLSRAQAEVIRTSQELRQADALKPLPEGQQRQQLQPNQIAWINERYGKAFWRDGEPSFTHTHCALPR